MPGVPRIEYPERGKKRARPRGFSAPGASPFGGMAFGPTIGSTQMTETIESRQSPCRRDESRTRPHRS
jgi:hypothetical protein